MKSFNFMKSLEISAFIFLNFIAEDIFAQNDQSIQGINAATDKVKDFFEPATKLMYAASAIIGLIGGIKVYSKWNSGDPDTQKVAASWFGACIFLVVVATTLKTFFGLGEATKSSSVIIQ